MNIAVINIRDLIKCVVILCILALILVAGVKVVKGKEEISEESPKSESDDSSFLYCLEMEIPLMANEDSENKYDKETWNNSYKILDTELAMLYNINKNQELEENVNKEENLEVNIEEKEEERDRTVNDDENIKTAVIDENNIAPSFTNSESDIQVKNQSSHNIDDLIKDANYNIKNKNKIIIYHTHTCESYTSSEKYNYEMTGAYRTTDLNYTVSKVGDELSACLEQYGKTVVHDTTFHDYPSYNGSYDRSLNTLKNILNQNSDGEIAIDLHRDAVGSTNTYGPSVQIGDDKCAQLMFVVGTDGAGLFHPNWRENFKFALMMQKKANELYPGLFRPIILRNSRYNQHLTTATTIIEVGATGNTLDECLNSMKYLAKIFDEVMK